MADLTALIERLEAATGPSRETDHEIHTATNKALRAGFRFGHVPHYCSSVDDAVALAVRVLPGWYFEHIGNDAMGGDYDMSWVGWTVDISPGMSGGFQGHAKTLPVAICLAVLRALSAQEDEK